MKNKVLYIDLETGGTFENINPILQIYAYLEIDGIFKDDINIYIMPNKNDIISNEAIKVNGLTNDKLKSLGAVSKREAYNKFLGFLDSHVDKFNKSDKFFMRGWNIIGFDSLFLKKFFEDHGNHYMYSYFWSPLQDVYPLAGFIFGKERINMANFKLETVAKSMGVSVEGYLHDAKTDVLLTRVICNKLRDLEMFDDLYV